MNPYSLVIALLATLGTVPCCLASGSVWFHASNGSGISVTTQGAAGGALVLNTPCGGTCDIDVFYQTEDEGARGWGMALGSPNTGLAATQGSFPKGLLNSNVYPSSLGSSPGVFVGLDEGEKQFISDGPAGYYLGPGQANPTLNHIYHFRLLITPAGPGTQEIFAGYVWLDFGGNDTNGREFTRLGPNPYRDGEWTGQYEPAPVIVINCSFTDADKDGLCDEWETTGVPYAKTDGTLARYPLQGADDGHKDLYVEMDVMNPLVFHPSADIMLATAFANAPANCPVPNPDGTPGIRLHLLVNDVTLPFEAESTVVPMGNGYSFPLNAAALRQSWFGTVVERANDSDRLARLAAKAKAFRYCLAINAVSGGMYGGAAELGGDDFVICIGGETVEQTAAVFMHELGHCLGLDHGGHDGINGKPNYPSIMNYLLAYRIVGGFNELFWRLDYSRADFATLNELHLNETSSIGQAEYSSFKMPYHDNGTQPCAGQAELSLAEFVTYDFDLDCDKTDTDIPVDLNYFSGSNFPDCQNATPGQPLSAWNDWENITLRVADNGQSFAGAPSPTELTKQQRENLHGYFPFPLDRRGDANCDGVVNHSDIQPFIVAQISPTEYATTYAPCSTQSSDMNGDRKVDATDIQLFVNRLLPR
jgi:hypothetical protein